MKEELLHFVWQAKLLFSHDLVLTTGEHLQVVSPGIYNKAAGPDFFNSRIKIDDTTWVGNVEFHVLSSDWKLHNHQVDRAYDNVILHVVYHHNEEVNYPDGKAIPTLELKKYLPPVLLKRYDYLQKSKSTIPCEKIFSLPDDFKLNAWLERLWTERLERKVTYFRELLKRHDGHWEKAFYIYTARYFGMRTNGEPFEWLAERIPLHVITKHRNSLLQLHALCLGVAGFLNEDGDPEKQKLAKEYEFLKHKFGLETMEKSVWKFGRTRPDNFPLVRLYQFALLLHKSTHLFSKIIEADNMKNLAALYEVIYKGKPVLSKVAIQLLLINSVLPVMFLFGKTQHRHELVERVIDFYSRIPSEGNHIIRFWNQMGIRPADAAQSQALIELKSQYCDEMKCLQCNIGQNILLHA